MMVLKTLRTGGIALVAIIASALLMLTGCPPESGGDQNSGPPLAAPPSLQITARDQALIVTWTRVVALQGIDPTYTVYYGTSSNPDNAAAWPTPITPSESSPNLVTVTLDRQPTNDAPLVNGITYYVWVTCTYEGFGESALCPTATGMPVPPPAAVGVLDISAGEGMLQIAWEAVHYAGEYEVHHVSGDTPLPSPPEESYLTMQKVSSAGAVLLGLATGQTYTVWVRASNTAGKSATWQRGAGSPTAPTAVPARPPLSLDVIPGDGKLSLSWPPLVGVPEYKVWYGTGGSIAAATELSEAVPTAATTVTADITGLTNGTSYTIWVKSSNSIGVSVQAVTASATPQPKPPINFDDLNFVLGYATGEYTWVQDIPPSILTGPDGWPGRDRQPRVQEMAIGNLYTDGSLWYFRKTYDPTIDFVLLYGGYIEGAIHPGPITTGYINMISKYSGERSLILSMRGDKLKLFFDEIAAIMHTGRGNSGTRYWALMSKEVRYTIQYPRAPEGTVEAPSEERQRYYYGRIKAGSLTIHGEPIDDARTYRIATTLPMLETYLALYQYSFDRRSLPDYHFIFALEEYIYDKGYITPYLDGRIKLEGGVPLPPPWTPGDWVLP
jgi:hypothetical protein